MNDYKVELIGTIDSLRRDIEECELQIKAKNKIIDELVENLTIATTAGRNELTEWLINKKWKQDEPLEREKVIVLRMFVVHEALKKAKVEE